MVKKTLVLTIGYNEEITEETLQIWEEVARQSSGVVSAHARFATGPGKKSKDHTHPRPAFAEEDASSSP